MQTNYLAPTSFQVSINRLPNVEFFVQRANIPALTMTPVEIGSPLSSFYETPDRISYSDFDLSFVVDEDMENYLEIMRWMESMGSSEDLGQYNTLKESEEGTKSDISVVIHNSHKNPHYRLLIRNAFPVSISSVALNVVTNDITYPEVTVTFRYDIFNLEKL